MYTQPRTELLCHSHCLVCFSPHTVSTSSQFKSSKASILTHPDTAPSLNQLPHQPSPHVGRAVSVLTLQPAGFKRKLQNLSPESSLSQPARVSWHGEHRNLPLTNGSRQSACHSSQCCTRAVQFSIWSQRLALKNKLNSWFNCSAQTGTNFSTGMTFLIGQCCKLTINQVITNI